MNPGTVPGGTFTVIVPVDGGEGQGCNATCQKEAREGYEKVERKRVLAAGIGGACMVLVALGFVGWVVWAWRRKRRRRREDDNGDGGRGIGEGIGGGFVMRDVGANGANSAKGEGKAESGREDGDGRVRPRTPSLEDT